MEHISNNEMKMNDDFFFEDEPVYDFRDDDSDLRNSDPVSDWDLDYSDE